MLKWIGILALPLALCAQATAPQAAAPQTAAPQAAASGPNHYVGSAVCKTCHPDVTLNFYKNPHYKSVASGKEAPEKTGCEGCHGAGGNHVAARGGKMTIPHAFSQMTPKQVLDDCLQCHSKDISKANIQRSIHTESDVVCSNCHSIHKPATPKFLLTKVQRELCYDCHQSVRAQFDMPVKHRVNEGAVQCSDCHNPHGTFASTWSTGLNSRMVDQSPGGEEACVKCHQEKRGPFVYEHAAIRVGGCETCHSPHGSMNSKLLRRPVVYTLCLECHNGAGSGVSAAGVLGQSSAHNMLDPRFQNCTLCHSRIHGSNSDANLLR